MIDAKALLEAHVAFELVRWTGDRLDTTVQEHVTATSTWLAETRVGDVAPAEDVAAAAGRLASDLVLTDELLAAVADVAASGHAALTEHPATISSLVAPEEYRSLVDLVAGLESVRTEVIEAVTASRAYSKLVAHVLYQGLKGYLLTENVVARKVPGASSLVRLGQRGLNSAAPRLEAGVDKRLTAFVGANLSETLRESRRYLEDTLNPEMMREMADEVWSSLAERPLGAVVGLLEPADTRALAVSFVPVLRRWRDEGLLAQVAERVALEELTRHEDRTVGELLDEWGVEVDSVVADVVEVLRPALEHAHASGFLEERLRAQLTPFYEALPTILEAAPEVAAAPTTATGRRAKKAAPSKRVAATKKATAKKTAATKAATKRATTKKATTKKATTKTTARKPTTKAARRASGENPAS